MPTPLRKIHRPTFPSSNRQLSLLVIALVALVGLPAAAVAQTTVFTEGFDGYFPGLQGQQCDTALLVYGSGTIPGWTGSGVNHSHAVDLDPAVSTNFALQLYTGGTTTAPNALTLTAGIPANVLGTSYSFTFDAAPSTWSHCNQATTAADGLVIEILRADDSVLVDHLHMPGAWAGGANAQNLTSAAGFTWTGDGSGPVRIRISSLRSNTNTFAGAIDNIKITGGGGVPPTEDDDADDDGILDEDDNCVNTPNPDQADNNGNGIGDACEASADVCDTGSTGACCSEDFSDDTLDAAWNLSELGDATGAMAEVVADQLHLTGTGSEMYHAADHGSFLHQTVSSDFRIEMDITGVPDDQGGQYRKGGVMVRSDLEPDAPRVMVQYIPHFPDVDPGQPDYPALQFDARDETGLGFELASTVPDVTLPVRVAIQRRGDLFTVFFSTDGGASWIRPLGGAGGEAKIIMPEETLAGASVASYDPSQSATFSFDGVGICRPSSDPRTPTTYTCESEAALDVVLMLDRSDSMSRPHGETAASATASKFQAARDSLRQLNSRLSSRSATTRVALLTFEGGSHAPTNQASGAVVESTFTDPESMDALLQTFDLGIADPYLPLTTTPMALAYDKALDMLLEERAPGHGVVVVMASDSLPNIDLEGEGPGSYAEGDVAGLGLSDGSGDYLTPEQVAWLGDFQPMIGKFTGQVLGDSMAVIEDLRNELGDARIFSLVPRGSVDNPPVLPEGLADYAAWYAQGAVHGATDPDGLEAAAADLAADINCGDELEPGLATEGDGDIGEGDGGDPEGPLAGCITDEFDDADLDAAWNPVFLGNADQGAVTEGAGTLRIEGDGTTAYAGSDNGVYVYRSVTGDFRAEVDVLGFPKNEGGAYRKAGLMVRAGLDPWDARIMIQLVPDFAGSGPVLQFRARTVDGGAGDVSLGSNRYGIGAPVRLAVDRTGNVYSVQYSTDGGTTWTTPAGGSGGSITADLGASPLLGMNVVSYDGNTTLEAELDNFSACAP